MLKWILSYCVIALCAAASGHNEVARLFVQIVLFFASGAVLLILANALCAMVMGRKIPG